jgi:hypothetical protein
MGHAGFGITATDWLVFEWCGRGEAAISFEDSMRRYFLGSAADCVFSAGSATITSSGLA